MAVFGDEWPFDERGKLLSEPFEITLRHGVKRRLGSLAIERCGLVPDPLNEGRLGYDVEGGSLLHQPSAFGCDRIMRTSCSMDSP
jgi:hypothetical protein